MIFIVVDITSIQKEVSSKIKSTTLSFAKNKINCTNYLEIRHHYSLEIPAQGLQEFTIPEETSENIFSLYFTVPIEEEKQRKIEEEKEKLRKKEEEERLRKEEEERFRREEEERLRREEEEKQEAIKQAKILKEKEDLKLASGSKTGLPK